MFIVQVTFPRAKSWSMVQPKASMKELLRNASLAKRRELWTDCIRTSIRRSDKLQRLTDRFVRRSYSVVSPTILLKLCISEIRICPSQYTVKPEHFFLTIFQKSHYVPFDTQSALIRIFYRLQTSASALEHLVHLTMISSMLPSDSLICCYIFISFFKIMVLDSQAHARLD